MATESTNINYKSTNLTQYTHCANFSTQHFKAVLEKLQIETELIK